MGLYQRLKGLKQYKNLTDDELKKLAIKIGKKISVGDEFIDKKEKRYAKDLLGKYLEDYDIENISDKNLLRQLIYLEVLDLRLRKILNKFHADNKASPMNLVNEFHTNINQIAQVKKTLGLTKEQQQQEKSDAFKSLETLKKKFQTYILENRDEFSFRSPCCGKIILLRRRVKDFDALEHPHFKGSILYNQKLLDLINEKKISVEDAADVLATSPDYILWIIKKYYKVPDKESGEE